MLDSGFGREIFKSVARFSKTVSRSGSYIILFANIPLANYSLVRRKASPSADTHQLQDAEKRRRALSSIYLSSQYRNMGRTKTGEKTRGTGQSESSRLSKASPDMWPILQPISSRNSCQYWSNYENETTLVCICSMKEKKSKLGNLMISWKDTGFATHLGRAILAFVACCENIELGRFGRQWALIDVHSSEVNIDTAGASATSVNIIMSFTIIRKKKKLNTRLIRFVVWKSFMDWSTTLRGKVGRVVDKMPCQ